MIQDQIYLLRQSTIAEESSPEATSALSWQFLLCVAALTVLVRVAYMTVFESWDFKHDWAFGHEMGRIGQWLAQGKGFTLDGSAPTAKFPPVYPLLVGGIFYVFGAYTKAAAVSLFLFQSVCSALIAVCIANLGNRLFGRTTGVIAGLLWAVYPTSIFYSAVRIWYCELAILLLLLVITIALTSRDAISSGRVALLGALSGLTVLTDSTLALYLPLLFLWMLVARRVQPSRLVILVALWGITAGSVTGPWMLRNWLVLGSPLLLKSNLGMELFIGNNPEAIKGNERRETFAALQQEKGTYFRGQSEVAYDRHLRDKAVEWMREHPLEFLSLTARRIFYFWVMNPTQGWESLLRLAVFGPFMLLALYGLYYCRQRQWQLAPLWLFFLVYPLPYYVTHVDHGRYSYPVEPLVLMLAVTPMVVWFHGNQELFGTRKRGNGAGS